MDEAHGILISASVSRLSHAPAFSLGLYGVLDVINP
jgi:hypothetical protein